MTIYLTEKQIEKINALAIQRYSPNEKIQTVSSSALNMIVNLPPDIPRRWLHEESEIRGSGYFYQWLCF